MHVPMRAAVALASLVSLAVPLPALAQGAVPSSPTPAASPPPSPVPAAPPASVPPATSAAASGPSLEERVAKQQEQIDALTAKTREQEAALQTLRESEEGGEEPGFVRTLSFWGFSDLNFGGIDYDNDHALYKVLTPSKLTFFSDGINLYAKSDMTRQLTALVETRITYGPNGYTSAWPATAYVGSSPVFSGYDNTQGNLVTAASKVNTTVQDPYTQLPYRLNGVQIERAYLEWRPTDWLGVRVGQFLTPFGIWNEDHGAPVLIGVDNPQFMNFGIVPIWQLGVEAFGSVALSDDLRMDYAVTVANSRGPEDNYKDLGNMKALGARLKFVFNPEPFLIRVGGYAYYSEYRDVQENIFTQLTAAGTIDPSYSPAFGDAETVTESYDETILTADAEVRIGKLRLLGEFARQTVMYTQPFLSGTEDKLLTGVPSTVTTYDPNHYGLGGYAMIAYEIPFSTKLLDFSVTPYAGYDYVVPTTSDPVRNNTQWRAGLNVKPSPYVTVKAEVARVVPDSSLVASDAWAGISQVAFSF